VLTAPFDVVLRDAGGSSTAPGKSGGERFHDIVMYGTIPNFPCNQGQVCFGQTGVVKGKCSPGTCTTVSWNTSNGAANCTTADETPPGGQCRHQQVCVVGYGASLSCTANCTPVCGGSTTLNACISAPKSRGPFTLALSGSDGTSQSQSTVGDVTGSKCLDFTVTPTLDPTTYTLTVTDAAGCTRTASVTIHPQATTASITGPSTPGCNGVVSFTAAAGGRTGCGFTWTIDGVSLASFSSGGAVDDARVARVSGTGTLEFRALDNTCHTIAVSATCGGCAATASTKVKQCAGSIQSCP
jgi:hypothetical protein